MRTPDATLYLPILDAADLEQAAPPPRKPSPGPAAAPLLPKGCTDWFVIDEAHLVALTRSAATVVWLQIRVDDTWQSLGAVRDLGRYSTPNAQLAAIRDRSGRLIIDPADAALAAEVAAEVAAMLGGRK